MHQNKSFQLISHLQYHKVTSSWNYIHLNFIMCTRTITKGNIQVLKTFQEMCGHIIGMTVAKKVKEVSKV